MKLLKKLIVGSVFSIILHASGNLVIAQSHNFTAVSATVDFSKKLRKWDGFGFNYVQTSQTFDFKEWPQDYGGFKFLKEKDKEQIIDLVFGEEGLKVGLLKMFLDPLHQQQENGKFDHRLTTRSLVYFAKKGLELSRKNGRDLNIITTMYGPPAFITKQKIIRGRDLDTTKKSDLVNYMVDWLQYLRKEEKLPVNYISLHNEGEDWKRWPQDGTLGETNTVGHDYNFFWSPQQLTTVMKDLRRALDKADLKNVGITPGENTNWYRFSHWGFARALYEDDEALDNMALITSHGFYVGDIHAAHWFGPHSNIGIDLIREKKSDIHAWVTSTAWQTQKDLMSPAFVKEIHNSIYEAKVNGIIPWAGIQAASQWNKPDPNPGCGIRVYDNGTFEVQKGYYYYKQVSQAGQPGMGVAFTEAMDSEVSLIAFSANGTKNPNAIIVINQGTEAKKVSIVIKGSEQKSFKAYRTSGQQVYMYSPIASRIEDNSDDYKALGSFNLNGSELFYEAPAGSVTTFFAE